MRTGKTPWSNACGAGLALALLAAVSGADASSFTNYGPIYSSYKKAGDAGGGCISGSIGTTMPGKNFNVMVTFVSEANAESDLKRAYFGFSTLDKRHDFDDGHERASVFRLCLKPGNYQLVGINAQNSYNTERVHVPFKVEAGKHYYLGSFVFHRATTASFKCNASMLPLFVEVRDEQVRDLPVIMKPEKSVGIEPEVRLVDPSRGHPYFQSCSDVGKAGG